jgi:hypothetical protein
MIVEQYFEMDVPKHGLCSITIKRYPNCKGEISKVFARDAWKLVFVRDLSKAFQKKILKKAAEQWDAYWTVRDDGSPSKKMRMEARVWV